MTISGAAASSVMGYHTSFSRAFALTLFNIRLGYWLVNPRIYDDEMGAVEYSEHAKPGESWSCGSQLRRQLGSWTKRCDEKAVFWPLYLWHELTASAGADMRLVNLSDGGHTGDNVGIYPLLQRRCKLIVACDAECDPEYRFGSLTSAIRQIYADENVEVDIDLDAIRPAKPGDAPRAHFTVGRIGYPDCTAEQHDQTGNETASDAAAGEGWIIYLKSSFRNKGEAATVKSYAARYSDFPHQTTGDQFFDDDQFESYLALGAHVAETMLGMIQEPADMNAETLIAWCRDYWREHCTLRTAPTEEETPQEGRGNETGRKQTPASKSVRRTASRKKAGRKKTTRKKKST